MIKLKKDLLENIRKASHLQVSQKNNILVYTFANGGYDENTVLAREIDRTLEDSTVENVIVYIKHHAIRSIFKLLKENDEIAFYFIENMENNASLLDDKRTDSLFLWVNRQHSDDYSFKIADFDCGTVKVG